MKITIEILCALAEKYNHRDIDFADKYGEPGYTTDKDTILFSNWNPYPKRILDRLERDFELEWSDEWLVKNDLSPTKAYRTRPDSYSWTPSYKVTEDGELLTQEDIDEDPESYVQTLIGNSSTVDIFKIDIEELGFTILPEKYESGWYGTTDNPEGIMDTLKKEYPNHDVLFTSFRNEQFRSTWKAAIRPKSND